MVLTEEELMLAISSEDRRIQSNLLARWSTDSLGTQCCCDREIQRYLLRKGTAAYKFNCFIIHQPARFIKMAALLDHGWSEHGPTDSNLITIYHKSSVYPIFRSNCNTNPREKINNLNKNPNNNTNVAAGMKVRCKKNVVDQDRDEDDEPIGCGWRLFSCFFV